MKFQDLPLVPSLLDGIHALGFEETTPIQEEAIPEILNGNDVIACAQTGTGKTAAYLIPTINKFAGKSSEQIRALIVTPTRELAMQIDQNVDALAYYTGVSSISIVGGGSSSSWDQQKFGLENGADLVIATPGRLKMHISLGYVNFQHVELVILDEADKMLDMGFYADIIQIIKHLPKERQTLLFSATMPKKIRELAREIMNAPTEISLNLAKPAEGILQTAYSIYDEQKLPLLEYLIESKEIESMIIFASSKSSVDEITKKLRRRNLKVDSIHSDKAQEEREETLRNFKNKSFPILVGTDVLARGIDIDNLSHVLNYDVPRDAEDYVHRIGRTARASATGEAITLISPKDQRKMMQIERLIESEVPKAEVPESLGETPEYRPVRNNKGKHKQRNKRYKGKSRSGSGNRDNNSRSQNYAKQERKEKNHKQREEKNKDEAQKQPIRGKSTQEDNPRKRKGRSRRRPRPNPSPAADENIN